jgi:hypothetical protein
MTVLIVTLCSGEAHAEDNKPPLVVDASQMLTEGVRFAIACEGVGDTHYLSLQERDPFHAWQGTFQFMGGYSKKTSAGPGGPTFDYFPLAVRIGCMCWTPSWDGCLLRGNIEMLLEANWFIVHHSFGSYVRGPCLIARYNFVQQDSLIVPYLQGGAGLAFTDAYRSPPTIQRLIGQETEFLLRAEVGARFMLHDKLSVDAEFGFQHISNAGLGLHNGGVNNLNLHVGFTYFFGRYR